LLIRFDGVVDRQIFDILFDMHLIVITLIYIAVYSVFDMYLMILKHLTIEDVIKSLGANFFSAVLVLIYNNVVPYFKEVTPNRLPNSVIIIATMLVIGLSIAIRIAPRGTSILYNNFKNKHDQGQKKRLLIFGAGNAGAALYRDLTRNPSLNYKIVCFYDDDNNKSGERLNGIKVFGRDIDIKKLCDNFEIDEIIVAIPSATHSELAKIFTRCKETKCRLKTIPALYDLVVDGEITLDKVRDVDVNDLLGREETHVDVSKLSGYISGETVLVTGGGGSIGSELCLQIMSLKPKRLIVFDIYENNAYDLVNSLKTIYGNDAPIKTYIGSVRDYARLESVFKKERPGIIFHAAAHKHVPLMEDSPGEAVKNNVFGTLNVVKVSDAYNVKRFVLISTDKAVNPTNVMGATKRVAEMIIQSFDKCSKTEYVAVRFGNVLGSNGSVIPLFKKQISDGGPVTVTHREITRYFMTIPEAASLVIEAGAMARGGEIFILDMGRPIKIADLAIDMIKLSGLTPGVDIKIVYTGLRPGEKLYEELLQAEEGTTISSKKGIFVGKPFDSSFEEVSKLLEELNESTSKDDEAVVKCLKKVVKTYHPTR